MDYGHLLFKRGYLITDSSLNGSTGRYAGLVQGWKKKTARSLAIYAHPDLDLNINRNEDLTVVLLGFAVDPSKGTSDAAEIAKRLHSLYLVSTEGFFEYLDTLNSGSRCLWIRRAGRSFCTTLWGRRRSSTTPNRRTRSSLHTRHWSRTSRATR